MQKKGDPRIPGSGRKKGTPNKLSIGKIEAAIMAEHPTYTTLQKHKAVATMLMGLLDEAKHASRHEFDVLDRLSRVLDRISPYDHPKLAAIIVKGDKDNPLEMHADISNLNKEQLLALKKLILHAGGGHTATAGLPGASSSAGRRGNPTSGRGR